MSDLTKRFKIGDRISRTYRWGKEKRCYTGNVFSFPKKDLLYVKWDMINGKTKQPTEGSLWDYEFKLGQKTHGWGKARKARKR